MVTLSSLTAALSSVGLLIANGAAATSSFGNGGRGSRLPEACPERCSVSGPNPGNWSLYPNFKEIKNCKQTIFYDFSLYDPVDDPTQNHKIHACSSFGPDFAQIPADPSSGARKAAAESVDVEFEMGWWEDGFGLAESGLRSLVKQLRHYADNGHGATDRPLTLYGQSGQATIGLYIGQGLLKQGLGDSALKVFQDRLKHLNVSTPSVAMQLCEDNYDSTHIFGVMATGRGEFTPVQDAIKQWANGTCLNFFESERFPGPAQFTTPLLDQNNSPSSLTTRKLHARGECKSVQVDQGDICDTLAEKCGISTKDIKKYNPGDDFCDNLMPKQHVCCSEGDLPDFSPQPNEDGSCHAYTIKDGDNCDNLAAEYSVTKKEIESFNKKTWGWNGCKLLFKESVMCLSKGTPPFPAPIANANCGPQKPGSKPPTDGSDIADMNPCPLNACCNIWGWCGVTEEFCTDTNTGAPGTAKPGTNGCISNCGTEIVKGDGAGETKIAYYEGYNFNRECLFQDPTQIDTSKYTHVHFGFGMLTAEWDVEMDGKLSEYAFSEFKRIEGVKRILSFGGWDFSTMPETYKILREGVKKENRGTMAKKIADFIKDNGLDGVDIDWEYPGAPDLPENDPGSKEDGPNYVEFLKELKDLLPGKSVSIAAPASYWYLKQFPIKEISKVVDYIVYMTYDLHGQWDAHNKNSQEGCETGNCLRSQVNITETKQSLAMITKAGVPAKKVVVGVTSYGRSFKMAEEGCWGPECQYTGDRLNSDAKKGKCTGTAGYIADAEIAEILGGDANAKRSIDKRVTKHLFDEDSDSDILVYDTLEWVGYMSASTKAKRAALYAGLGFGGTTDWASDLQTYHDVPEPAGSWANYKKIASNGGQPKADHTRNGNWTDMDCTHPMIVDKTYYTPSERWGTLNGDAAWDDVRRIWEETRDNPNRIGVTFMESVTEVIHMGDGANCGSLTDESCDYLDCPDGANGDTSGPAAQLLWESMVRIHKLHSDYWTSLFHVAALTSMSLDDLENKFAPIPPEEDNTWLLLMIDLLTLGALGTAGPFFNTFLKGIPGFLQKGSRLDNLKDTSMTLIGQSTTIAKDVLPSKDLPWTEEGQDAFSNYMSQVVGGWANITTDALEKFFDGSSASLDKLESLMANGQLVKGKYETEKPAGVDDESREKELRANIQKCFYGFAIPALWQVSKSYAFIIDAGHDCDEGKQLTDYLEDETMDDTGVCVDGKQYYLAYPKGDAVKCGRVCKTEHQCEDKCWDQKFSMPPGLDSLGEGNFGGITKEDLVKGAVATWIKNGKENGGDYADPTNQGTIDNLMDVDVTTAGFMKIPVCSPERAFQSWDTTDAGSSDNYPCDIPPGKDRCGDSTFENETSGASPNKDDCLEIIKNIEGDGGTQWTTQVLGKNQREIASKGSCAFGVEATEQKGNADFKVGGQDVIDLIKAAVDKFADGDGKIGAKGDMKCDGNIKQQGVKWGIYHT